MTDTALNLMDLISKPEAGPAQVTLVGEGGVGKTSLAALFPSPVFMRVEDGTTSLTTPDMEKLNIRQLPIIERSEDVLNQIRMLATQDHPFKTLVIDTITKLHHLIEKEIITSDSKCPKSINQALGGYGAGHNAASERHRMIKLYCDRLMNDKKMNIVFIAHAESETIDPPDSDSYIRYSLRMNGKSRTHYTDDVDLCGFIKLKKYVMGEEGERKKATSDGQRIITCYPTASHVSKNRYGIEEDLTFNKGENPLARFIPSLRVEKAPAEEKPDN